MSVLVMAAWLLTTLILGACLYRAIFAVAYIVLDGKVSDDSSLPLIRFAAVIPAHNEQLLIRDVIQSIRQADYPQGSIDIFVVADNCTDDTAALAREVGARVEERHDLENRGKGQALQWLFDRLDLNDANAIAIIDADNRVHRDFFRAMNRELGRGARCLQGFCGIVNPSESALTRLMTVTGVMKNLLFKAGKSSLGLSVVLTGTGMAFSRDVMQQHGWQATSIGEDLEQTFNLLEGGECIEFVADARVDAQEASSLRQGYSQRQRWASGRSELAGRARRAIANGIRERNILLADVGLDLLMPSYSKLMNWTGVALVLAIILSQWSTWLLPTVIVALVYQGVEIVIGLRLLGAKPEFVASLAYAPIFLAWKAVVDGLASIGFRRADWRRTSRKPHSIETPAGAAPKREGSPSGRGKTGAGR
jgi:cellulose synthase/poly-beta-1,6-N-acetylglucosamine synthase-like glycosyltransferase